MKKYLSLTVFFLRSFLFNPLNNPVFVILTILIVFFYIEGSLDKYHIALMLYLSVIGHSFVGNMFRRSREADGKSIHMPITGYFQALPLSGKSVYVSYLLSSGFYAIFISSALVILLMKFMQLPDLADIEFYKSVTPDGDTITTVTGFTFSRRIIPRFVSFVLEKSLFFDVLAKPGGATLLILFYFVLAYLYVSVFQVFDACSRSGRISFVGWFHRLPFLVYSLFTLLFLTEIMLSQREIGIGTRFILDHLDIVLSLLVITVILTILSILFMSRTVVKKLRVLPA